MPFEDKIPDYIARAERALAETLPAADVEPTRLHEAMRYATLNGGKRIRPLLVYASGEMLGVDPAYLDAPAIAIELIHAFSLVHDDLPAMDDDDLRRGLPTVHRHFDEATAILAADALQPLAFQVLSSGPLQPNGEAMQLRLVQLLARACGSLGMTGGQSIDLQSEGHTIGAEALETMYRLKTGALILASIESAAVLCPNLSEPERQHLLQFGRCLGLAFQIRDDILDVEGETEVIGKQAGSDAARHKATWPGLFGVAAAKARCKELFEEGMRQLEVFGDRAAPLQVLAHMIVERRD
jgi:farnesyl diphosphate synthase